MLREIGWKGFTFRFVPEVIIVNLKEEIEEFHDHREIMFAEVTL